MKTKEGIYQEEKKSLIFTSLENIERYRKERDEKEVTDEELSKFREEQEIKYGHNIY